MQKQSSDGSEISTSYVAWLFKVDRLGRYTLTCLPRWRWTRIIGPSLPNDSAMVPQHATLVQDADETHIIHCQCWTIRVLEPLEEFYDSRCLIIMLSCYRFTR
jgi:hypothetical protein